MPNMSSNFTDNEWSNFISNYGCDPTEYDEDPNIKHPEYLNMLVKHFQFDKNHFEGFVKYENQEIYSIHPAAEHVLEVFRVQDKEDFYKLLKPLDKKKLAKITHLKFSFREMPERKFKLCTMKGFSDEIRKFLPNVKHVKLQAGYESGIRFTHVELVNLPIESLELEFFDNLGADEYKTSPSFDIKLERLNYLLTNYSDGEELPSSAIQKLSFNCPNIKAWMFYKYTPFNNIGPFYFPQLEYLRIIVLTA